MIEVRYTKDEVHCKCVPHLKLGYQGLIQSVDEYCETCHMYKWILVPTKGQYPITKQVEKIKTPANW